jgi:GT2 family glycosyltransferase
MFISVVIPTYNVVDLLQQNLPHVIAALEAYDKKKVELIVTDNHSSDNSVEFLKDLQKKAPIPITVLANSWNGGFAVNVNRGLRVAKGDIIILLGTDVRPEKDFIKPLLPHFKDEKVFAVGCVNQSDEDAGKNMLRGRGIGRWEKGFLFHSHGELINDDTLWVDCGSGAFRKSILDNIGFLQELYAPYYWEDVDLSYRAQKMGYKVKIEKRSRVVHEHKKGSIKKEKPSAVQQIVYRNQFFFTWLNITDRNLLYSHFRYLPYHVVNAIKGKNWIFLKGLFLALTKLEKVREERKKLIPKFVVKDREILARFKDEV